MIEQIARRNKRFIETTLKGLSHIPELQTKIDVTLKYLSDNKGVFKDVLEIQKATVINLSEHETEELLLLLKYQKLLCRRYSDERGLVFKILDK